MSKPVQMGNGDNFTSNIIIETVYSISVDKTVSNPNTSLDAILYFTTNLYKVHIHRCNIIICLLINNAEYCICVFYITN